MIVKCTLAGARSTGGWPCRRQTAASADALQGGAHDNTTLIVITRRSAGLNGLGVSVHEREYSPDDGVRARPLKAGFAGAECVSRHHLHDQWRAERPAGSKLESRARGKGRVMELGKRIPVPSRFPSWLALGRQVQGVQMPGVTTFCLLQRPEEGAHLARLPCVFNPRVSRRNGAKSARTQGEFWPD